MATGDHPTRAHPAAEHHNARHWPDHDKARLWDELAAATARPGLRDTWIRHLSGMRRAANLLLAHREELPPALARELDSYKVTLDALHLEAIDGFTDAEGVLNLLPTHIIISLMGAISTDHATR